MIAQLEDMDRTWISVEFRRQGQAHAAASAEIGNLLVGECLNSSVLPAGIGRRGGMLGLRGGQYGERSSDCET
jgi:hypothetical protein